MGNFYHQIFVPANDETASHVVFDRDKPGRRKCGAEPLTNRYVFDEVELREFMWKFQMFRDKPEREDNVFAEDFPAFLKSHQ